MDIENANRELDRARKTIQQQAEEIAALKALVRALQDEVERLKELLGGKADAKSAKKPKFTDNYSTDRHEQKQKKGKREKSTGRRPFNAKRNLATLEIDIYPDGVPHENCIRHRSQLVWRIDGGKAVYVCYHIYDVPESQHLPLPPAVRNEQSEYGIEIILILAFLHYWIGVSLDHACTIIEFFTGLKLTKSQADSLLSQLSKDWNEQYETIAELISLQMIVYIDETGWKVGKKSCYTWVFSTAMHVLFRCGVSRKKDEATAVLGHSFAGIGVTDDYNAYKKLFTQHQLCWAHLIRKAIKLALQHPDQPEYSQFLDQLCSIYADAKNARNNDQMSAAERHETSAQLQQRIVSLCTRSDGPIEPAMKDTPEETFILLQRELVSNLESLFVFVENPKVEPTNNRSERNVRREAEIRKGARTSKSASSAYRRSVIVTVLASLQTRIAHFTLANLLAEIHEWLESGSSRFQQELAGFHNPNAPPTAPSPSC